MEIERIEKNRIVFTFENEVDLYDIQNLIDYAKYLDATALSQAKQEEVDALADEVSRNWWIKNKHRFVRCG